MIVVPTTLFPADDLRIRRTDLRWCLSAVAQFRDGQTSSGRLRSRSSCYSRAISGSRIRRRFPAEALPPFPPHRHLPLSRVPPRPRLPPSQPLPNFFRLIPNHLRPHATPPSPPSPFPPHSQTHRRAPPRHCCSKRREPHGRQQSCHLSVSWDGRRPRGHAGRAGDVSGPGDDQGVRAWGQEEWG